MKIKTRWNFKEIVKNKEQNKNLYFNPDIKTMDWDYADRTSLNITNNNIYLEQWLTEIWKRINHWSIKNFIEFIEKSCKDKNIENIDNLSFNYDYEFNSNGELYIKTNK